MQRKPKIQGEVKIRPIDDVGQDEEIGQIFFGEGLEPVTEELIAELVGAGKFGGDVAVIRKLAADGYRYSRSRDSFILPGGFQMLGDLFGD
jgi:hypothetical protein